MQIFSHPVPLQSKQLFQIEMHTASELGKVPTSLLRLWANTMVPALTSDTQQMQEPHSESGLPIPSDSHACIFGQRNFILYKSKAELVFEYRTSHLHKTCTSRSCLNSLFSVCWLVYLFGGSSVCRAWKYRLRRHSSVSEVMLVTG